jgi:cell division protein FtsL
MIRMSTIFWCLLAILASGIMYHTSDHVQMLQKELDGLNEQIAAEQEATHVLKAEWSYVASPARLEMLATKYLGTQRAKSFQIITMKQLDERLPLKNTPAPIIAANVPKPLLQPMPNRVTVAQADNTSDTSISMRNLLNNLGSR